ncbi:Mannose-6-phosphate isomerase (Cupin domain) [Orpheovirus IHUMI-LCC2]|uniref:Mannose-6-phosphate isomerase (Cupin domain) n=1 Tax=Orpheovirus IHUMI-LCC2 TaxID=2023057 RepID=A0A2I2L397_9VIRU|nr:Mannose-6-phosphate isomerase (Cupin domain) [Orpheovirus IHUMI-LCC2]SNW62004.1 Mannose-6-phosphate isomerase (Cupin domain) [Orpheovirus IHUMI-LCC2]
MASYDIVQSLMDDTAFRRVISTTSTLQITTMVIDIGGEIGWEIHPNTDQMIYVIEGTALGMIGDNDFNLYTGSMLVIPRGSNHNVTNVGNNVLKLMSVYSNQLHPVDEVQQDNSVYEQEEENY